MLTIIILFIFAVLSTQFKLGAKMWHSALAIAFIVFIAVQGFTVLNVVALLGLIVWGVLLYMAPLRKNLITKPTYNVLKHMLPEMSQTEAEAINAGTVGWEKQLLSAQPQWEELFAYSKPHLSDEEQAYLDNQVQHFCTLCNDWEITHDLHDLPADAWDYLKKEKFFGLVIAKEYGGLGFSETAHAAVVTKIASASITAGVTVMVPNSLGPGKLIKYYGTDHQRDYYLPRLANGEEVPCFALTSPHAGSDAGAIPDVGVVTEGEWEGKKVLGLKLNFAKRYITLAPVATLIGIAVQTRDPEGLLGGEEDLGITCALLPRDIEGMEIGARHNPLNTPFQNGPIFGTDVFIPMSQIIGGQEQIGQGWKMLMESLSIGRGISLPGVSNACGQKASQLTGAYARVRRQFNTSIANFEGVQEALARINSNAYMMHANCQLVLSALEKDEKPAVLSAMVKYVNTDTMRSVVNDSMDVFAGKGIMLGNENPIGLAYTSVPISVTVEGANILTRSLIIFGQGLIRCHPFILKEMQTLHSTSDTALDEFDEAFSGHAKHSVHAAINSFMFSYNWSNLNKHTKGYGANAKYFHRIAQLSAAMTVLVECAILKYGGNLKRKEMLSGRFAEAWSALTVASACIKQFHDDGSPEGDAVLMNHAVETQLYLAQTTVLELLEQMFPAPVRAALRLIICPPFSRVKKPNDALVAKVAAIGFTGNDSIDRLSRWAFHDEDENSLAHRLIAMRDAMPAYEALLKKQRNGEDLTADEATQVADLDERYYSAIKVDHYPEGTF